MKSAALIGCLALALGRLCIQCHIDPDGSGPDAGGR